MDTNNIHWQLLLFGRNLGNLSASQSSGFRTPTLNGLLDSPTNFNLNGLNNSFISEERIDLGKISADERSALFLCMAKEEYQ
jgi:hypothetical protein